MTPRRSGAPTQQIAAPATKKKVPPPKPKQIPDDILRRRLKAEFYLEFCDLVERKGLTFQEVMEVMAGSVLRGIETGKL
jgi:hypothetical protein